LRAVAEHTGTLESGHYVAVAVRDGEWYRFNDGSVSHADPPLAESNAAYLMFCEKIAGQ
jgi:ubiquitin C-terminal hydrolase